MPDSDPPDTSESLIAVPSRRTPVPPVQLALRRADRTGASEPVRSWAPLGTLDAGVLAHVDPAGSVQGIGRNWCLDWWVGAEDRWHHPSMEAAVRQQPLAATPVVQTSLRVPGGDVVQRAFGAVGRGQGWSTAGVVVEFENCTSVPVALALVVRPLTLDGPGQLRDVQVSGTDVRVDGAPAVMLSRPPARMLARPLADSAIALQRGEDVDPFPDVPGEDLDLVLVVPLAHTAVFRVFLPPPTPSRRRARPAVGGAWEAPDADSVVAGWAHHGAGDPQLAVPVPGWSELLAWSAPQLRLLGPEEVRAALDPAAARPAGPPSSVRTAAVSEAMAALEVHEALDAVAAALAGATTLRGEVRLADRSDGTVALVFAAAGVLAGPLGAQREAELLGPLAKAVHRIGRGRGLDEVEPWRAATALRLAARAAGVRGQPDLALAALDLAARLDTRSRPAAAQRPPVDADADPAGATVTFDAMRAARSAVESGAPGALDDLAALLAERGPSPRSDRVERSGRAVGVLGADAAELAELRSTLLSVAVTDTAAGPRLLPSWSPAWNGQLVEASGVPTSWGRTSFVLRWHGGRPALLWEVETTGGGASGSTTPAITAPGPGPGWEGSGFSGEALLPDPPTDDSSGAAGGPPQSGPGEGDSFG